MTSGIPEVVPRALRGDPQSLCACSPGHCAGQGSGWGALAERGALAGHGVLGGLLSSGGASGTAAEAPAQVGRWVFQSHPGASGPHTASPSRVPRSLGTPGGGGGGRPPPPPRPLSPGGGPAGGLATCSGECGAAAQGWEGPRGPLGALGSRPPVLAMSLIWALLSLQPMWMLSTCCWR